MKLLPKLTSVGAWRVPRTGKWGTFTLVQFEEKATYEDITHRMIVEESDQSAKINITTEMPGLTIYYTFDGTDPG